MPPMFTRLLAERLQATVKLRVEEAREGTVVESGKVLIAPGDYHMRLQRNNWKTIVALDQGPPENSCRPAVDVLFRSAHEVYGSGVVAVVLTGMGSDGLRGTEILKASGACVIRVSHSDAAAVARPARTSGGAVGRRARSLAYASRSAPTFFRGSSVPTNRMQPF